MAGRHPKQLGATLVELVVASALVLLIMGELWMLLQTGTRFYLRSRATYKDTLSSP